MRAITTLEGPDAIMETRFTILADAPALYKALGAVTAALGASALPAGLKHLIDLRVSQINGCVFCIGKHSEEALRDGDRADRVAALPNWADSSLFTPDERAALAWAEALTRSESGRVDDLLPELGRHFSREQVAALTMAVATINAWNRVGIAQFREAVPAAA